MNERIKELYQKSTGKEWAYDFDTYTAEKFAELIIKECAEIANTVYPMRVPPGPVIEKHFGVE